MTYIVEPYDEAIRFILRNGTRRKNRTGVDTISVFSVRSEYDISQYFPLLTKRKLYPKSVFAELLWMLSGSTNNDDLVKLGCNFWTPWVDPSNPDNRAFYERTGYPVGYIGPTYGWQMRHFGGNYHQYLRRGNNLSFGEYGGFDQIAWLVNEIKANPRSRRLLVSLWNPRDMLMSRLPCCHYAFHVDIDDNGRMSLLLNQRSCDVPVGAPANIQFYSALCYMLAQQTGYMPYRFIHHTEDSHIYVSQLSQVEEYLARPIYDSPRLLLNKATDIFSYSMNDFQILGHKHGDAIKIPVEV